VFAQVSGFRRGLTRPESRRPTFFGQLSTVVS